MSNVLSCSFSMADLQESIVRLCNFSKIQAMCWGGAATGGGVLIGVPQRTWLCCKCVQQKAWRGKEVLCTALQCLHLQQNAGLYNDLRTVLTVFLSWFQRQSSSTHANGAWAPEQPKGHAATMYIAQRWHSCNHAALCSMPHNCTNSSTYYLMSQAPAPSKCTAQCDHAQTTLQSRCTTQHASQLHQ